MLKELLVVELSRNLINLIHWLQLFLSRVWIQAKQRRLIPYDLRYHHLLEFYQKNVEGQMCIC